MGRGRLYCDCFDYFVICLVGNGHFLFQVLDRPSQSLDRVNVGYEIEGFLFRNGWVNCMFPWCGEITVDRRFWDALAGIDDKRKGWLLDEVK